MSATVCPPQFKPCPVCLEVWRKWETNLWNPLVLYFYSVMDYQLSVAVFLRYNTQTVFTRNMEECNSCESLGEQRWRGSELIFQIHNFFLSPRLVRSPVPTSWDLDVKPYRLRLFLHFIIFTDIFRSSARSSPASSISEDLDVKPYKAERKVRNIREELQAPSLSFAKTDKRGGRRIWYFF